MAESTKKGLAASLRNLLVEKKALKAISGMVIEDVLKQYNVI